MATDDPYYFVCPGCGLSIDVRRPDVVYAIAKVPESTVRGDVEVDAAEAYFHSNCFRDHRVSWRAARRPEGV